MYVSSWLKRRKFVRRVAEKEARMIKNMPKKVETVAEYKKRLRLTTLRLPSSFVGKVVRSIPTRMKAAVENSPPGFFGHDLWVLLIARS